MSKDLHTIALKSGSSSTSNSDRLSMLLLRQQAYPAGNGDPANVAVATAGAGYAAIPTFAFANAGGGSGATGTVHMKALTAAVAAGGTGGTPGAVTVTGTTGTGTKFQATGVISAGGVLTGPLVVTVPGDYTAMPSSLTVEAVTGGSLSGATVALSIGVLSIAVGGSSNHAYPQSTTGALTGGTPTTAATVGAVAVTAVAGQGCSFNVTGSFPLDANSNPLYSIFPGDAGADLNVYTTNRTATGFTVNLVPNTSGAAIVAGAVDLLVLH